MAALNVDGYPLSNTLIYTDTNVGIRDLRSQASIRVPVRVLVSYALIFIAIDSMSAARENTDTDGVESSIRPPGAIPTK
eukprot:scaffold515543_cov29-Prasinocladus_malaysianus.AAC.1